MKYNRTPINSRRAGRRAFSLVETLIAMTLASLILGVTLTLAQSLMLADRKLHDRPAALAQLARLADGIRADIRLATDVSRPDEKQLAIQITERERIIYELTANGCQRRRVPSDGDGNRPESFSIGGALSWHIERMPTARHPLVSVTLRPDADSDSRSAPPPFWILAALGADRSLSATNE